MTIALLGAGVMGQTLLSALVRAGHDPASLFVSDKSAGRAEQVAGPVGARAVSATEAARTADILVLAVKPQDMEALKIGRAHV